MIVGLAHFSQMRAGRQIRGVPELLPLGWVEDKQSVLQQHSLSPAIKCRCFTAGNAIHPLKLDRRPSHVTAKRRPIFSGYGPVTRHACVLQRSGKKEESLKKRLEKRKHLGRKPLKGTN